MLSPTCYPLHVFLYAFSCVLFLYAFLRKSVSYMIYSIVVCVSRKLFFPGSFPILICFFQCVFLHASPCFFLHAFLHVLSLTYFLTRFSLNAFLHDFPYRAAPIGFSICFAINHVFPYIFPNILSLIRYTFLYTHSYILSSIFFLMLYPA